MSDLGFPVTVSSLRHATVPTATVPETAVHENRESFATKDEIRFAGERLMPPPAGDAMCAEDGGKSQFGGPIVGGVDCSHDFRALLLCKAISHRNLLLPSNAPEARRDVRCRRLLAVLMLGGTSPLCPALKCALETSTPANLEDHPPCIDS